MRFLLVFLGFMLLGCGFSEKNEGVTHDGAKRIVGGEPTCPECELALKEIARLGGPEDPGSIRGNEVGTGCIVSRLGTGEFLVGGVVGGGEIFVYDSSGSFSRTIGRPGEGPGEFGFRSRIDVGPGDTLFATDEGNARLQVMTASGEYVRSFSLPGNVRRFTLLGDGTLLFFRELWNPDDKPLYQLDTHGKELAVFGVPTLEEWPDEYWILAPSSSGGFWASNQWEYVLNKWEGPGHLSETLIREVDWFPPFGGFPQGMYVTVPAIPMLIDYWEDSSGLLWVVSDIPDPDWDTGVRPPPNPEWYLRTFDAVIEVIDPRNASLVTSRKHERRLARICGSELLYGIDETEEGDTRVQVLEPVLLGYDEVGSR